MTWAFASAGMLGREERSGSGLIAFGHGAISLLALRRASETTLKGKEVYYSLLLWQRGNCYSLLSLSAKQVPL